MHSSIVALRLSSVKEVKPAETTSTVTTAVSNSSNVDTVPPLQPLSAKRGVPPHKSASVHPFISKQPLLKTVRTMYHCVISVHVKYPALVVMIRS